MLSIIWHAVCAMVAVPMLLADTELWLKATVLMWWGIAAIAWEILRGETR